RFQGRNDVPCKVGTVQQRLEHARLRAAKPAARRSNQGSDDLLAITLAQGGMQVADAIGEPERNGSLAGPVFAGEQSFFRTVQSGSAALLNEADEAFVNLALYGLEPFDVVRIFGQERIEHGLALAGSVEPALDTELFHQLGEAERTTDHSDRADNRVRITDDLFGGARNHIPAGSCQILGKGYHVAFVLGGKLTDAAINQMRLDGRAAG